MLNKGKSVIQSTRQREKNYDMGIKIIYKNILGDFG